MTRTRNDFFVSLSPISLLLPLSLLSLSYLSLSSLRLSRCVRLCSYVDHFLPPTLCLLPLRLFLSSRATLATMRDSPALLCAVTFPLALPAVINLQNRITSPLLSLPSSRIRASAEYGLFRRASPARSLYFCMRLLFTRRSRFLAFLFLFDIPRVTSIFRRILSRLPLSLSFVRHFPHPRFLMRARTSTFHEVPSPSLAATRSIYASTPPSTGVTRPNTLFTPYAVQSPR